jgi:hypothetical protein
MIEKYPDNADLLIVRARLYYKDKTKVRFHSLFIVYLMMMREVFQ